MEREETAAVEESAEEDAGSGEDTGARASATLGDEPGDGPPTSERDDPITGSEEATEATEADDPELHVDDPDVSVTSPEPSVDGALRQRLDELQSEFDTLNDRHLRLAAEFNNYRRRQEAERLESWGRAQAELVGRFLEVLDDLQRVSALEPSEESVTVEAIVEGIDLVERKFLRTLEEAGAEIVAPEEGDPFDPETMEAMMRVDDETGERDDQVAELFARGYVFRDVLVRPARVSVYKA